MAIKTQVAERLPSKNYGYIIQVNVPVIFYWNKDGSFDGISLEINRPEALIKAEERIQIFQLLDRLSDVLNEGEKHEC